MIATFLPVDLYKAEITPLIGESTKIAALKNFFRVRFNQCLTIFLLRPRNKSKASGRPAAMRLLVLDYIEPFVKASVTTEYLDDLMLRYTENVLKDKSACLNYDPDGTNPYPKATCISVNHQICHGIPNEKVLKNERYLKY